MQHTFNETNFRAADTALHQVCLLSTSVSATATTAQLLFKFFSLFPFFSSCRQIFYLGATATESVGVHAGHDESLLGALLGVSGQVGEDLGSDDGITRHEVGVGNLVGQTQHANTDA